MASTQEPEAKKLRSSEPDLKVIIGSASAHDGKSDEADKQKAVVTKWYHSQTLATKSKYVDALLAVPMKESESRIITFPDISPEEWDLMMQFVDNPVAARIMTAQDVTKVARMYDKYEFADGLSLCNLVLKEYFHTVKDTCPRPTAFLIRRDDGPTKKIVLPDIDFIVDAVVLAHEANLAEAFESGITFVWKVVASKHIPIGRTMFSEKHMKKLAPLLDLTRERPAYGGVYPDPLQDRRSLYNEDLKSPDFPAKFVSESACFAAKSALSSFVASIEVSGSFTDVDGKFIQEFDAFIPSDQRTVSWNGAHYDIIIKLSSGEEGWVIGLQTPSPWDEDPGERAYDAAIAKVAWKAPYSGNLPLPPSTGWVPVDSQARGNIQIEYHGRRNTNSSNFGF